MKGNVSWRGRHTIPSEIALKIGVVFPQTEIGSDPSGVRDYAQAVEEMGFAHIVVFDHVIGATTEGRGFAMSYSDKSMFHEPFVLYGFLAALTKHVELVTGVIILPQRQTVLVAKQAAEIDVLSGGRLRLGVGIGWNPVEYEGLNEDFHNRGRRIEEQVDVLRKLWTEPLLEFRGKWHSIDRAGLNPLPVQRPIPIWLGGSSETAQRRIARIADGWMPNRKPPAGWAFEVERIRGWVSGAGRDPASFGIEGRANLASGTPEAWRAEVEEWRTLNATHVDLNTMGGGLVGAQAHIARLREARAALDV
ncbi:MAG TPA: LLM class F420-dependent oxidoreductase [Chloroflexota bacterium]|nr:LLM class F420-dependent oxidoreductase [Chloroflexota bacterium]